MGKPVLSLRRLRFLLLAATASALLTAWGPAPKAFAEPADTEEGRRAFGAFLSPDEADSIAAALGYLGLTPEDLRFDKMPAEARYRLPVVEQVLDDPMALPGVAEQAADRFSAKGSATWRAQQAGLLLGLGEERWTPEEMQKDAAELIRLDVARWEASFALNRPSRSSRKALERRAERTRKEYEEYGGRLLFGDIPKGCCLDEERLEGLGLDWWWWNTFAPSLCAMVRDEPIPDETELRALAALLPGLVAEQELPLPGARKPQNEADLFALAEKPKPAGRLVALARMSTLLQLEAARWRAEVWRAGLRGEDMVGEPFPIEGVTGGVLACWEGPLGKVVIGGAGPNTYEGDDFIGIIDLGGDDIYRGRVASAVGLPGSPALSWVLDLSGDDRYEGDDFTQGFGFLGVGILHDLGGGNDTYRARFCAQGCGLCGAGALYDDGGNDLYLADSGAQGAGVFGYGELVDAAGDDVYRGARFVQAFAQVGGVGVLADGSGNDSYFAGGEYLHRPLFEDRYQSLSQGFAIGNRYEGTAGGVALLLDEGAGNDVYQADIYGQGASYWFSLGMLVDQGGNDTYTLGQYGQGAGIHLSAGILVDLAGNDTYTNPYGVGAGGAHDYSVGWLIDRAGNDLYQGNGQGQGLNFSVGILLDVAGDDAHSSLDARSIGCDMNHSVGLLVDLAGEADVYSCQGVRNGRFTKRSPQGMVFDAPKGWFPGIDISTLPTRQDPPPERVVVEILRIGFGEAGGGRTESEADALARRVLREVRTEGADWAEIAANYGDDAASEPREISAETDCDEVLRQAALSVGVGEIVLSARGESAWYVVRRVE